MGAIEIGLGAIVVGGLAIVAGAGIANAAAADSYNSPGIGRGLIVATAGAVLVVVGILAMIVGAVL